MAVDDKKLLEGVLEDIEVETKDLRILDMFEDAKGNVWASGQPIPKLAGPNAPDMYRVLALFYAGGDENDVKAFCVPIPDRFPVQGFRVFRMHRFAGSIGSERMTQAVFEDTLGEELIDLEKRMLRIPEYTAEDLAEILEKKGILSEADIAELEGEQRTEPQPNGAKEKTAEEATT